nr:MAG TPA: Portal [Caudoviricetes sp.]
MTDIRSDGFFNAFLGYGTRRRDPFTHTYFHSGQVESIAARWHEYEELFTYNGIAQKIIKIPANDAVRAGFTLGDGDSKLEQNKAVQSIMEDLNFQSVFSKALCWDRLYGGGVVLMLIDDGGELQDPLNESAIKGIRKLVVYDAQDVTPEYDYQDPNHPLYGKPETYTIVGYNGGAFSVHESRLLIFDGSLISNRERRQRNGWGGSIMEQVRDNLMRFVSSQEFSLMAMERMSQSVLKLSGMGNVLSTDEGEKIIQKRLQLIDMARGMMNTIALDTEDEYNIETITMGGLCEMVDKFETALSAAADIPITVLMGQSPGGLDATGDSDLENYYNMVDRIRQRTLKPKINRLLHLLSLAHDVPLNLPDEYTIEFGKLWSPSAKEEADTKMAEAEARARDAATATQYVSIGALDTQEVRDKLDEGDFYKLDRSLDKVIEEAHSTPPKGESMNDKGNRSEA